MKSNTAEFTLYDKHRGEVVVVFDYDDYGKPRSVGVFCGDDNAEPVFVEDNRAGVLKACWTHVIGIVRRISGKPPQGEHAKQRAQKSKPELKVIG